jgi:hypothetical protein
MEPNLGDLPAARASWLKYASLGDRISLHPSQELQGGKSPQGLVGSPAAGVVQVSFQLSGRYEGEGRM